MEIKDRVSDSGPITKLPRIYIVEEMTNSSTVGLDIFFRDNEKYNNEYVDNSTIAVEKMFNTISNNCKLIMDIRQ